MGPKDGIDFLVIPDDDEDDDGWVQGGEDPDSNGKLVAVINSYAYVNMLSRRGQSGQ